MTTLTRQYFNIKQLSLNDDRLKSYLLWTYLSKVNVFFQNPSRIKEKHSGLWWLFTDDF